jgi:peptidoglycan/LPS O-acetylase OafA/YrhL
MNSRLSIPAERVHLDHAVLPLSKSLGIPSLDGWRAVAILIVFLGHTGLGNIFPGGFGITIFFFLSGYLITSLMIIERQAIDHAMGPK